MRSGWQIATTFLCMIWMAGVCAFGQGATVVFYSHGSNWTTGLPGTVHDIYFGNVFDGKEDLFAFRDGFFAHNNRYLIFQLSPGPHVFGASNAKKPEDRETLALSLEAGKNYFVRAQGESKGVPGVYVIQHGRLDQVDCADATKELEKAKPLGEKALSKYTRAHRDLFSPGGLPLCP